MQIPESAVPPYGTANLPVSLVRICEAIFKGLPADDARALADAYADGAAAYCRQRDILLDLIRAA